MSDQPAFTFFDPGMNIRFVQENYGGWTGETAGPNGEELSIYLPGKAEESAPAETNLSLLAKIIKQLPALRVQAIPFARLEVIHNLDKWGLRDENGVPLWETYDDMPPWGTMTEAEYDAEFQLMGILLPEEPVAPDEFALGFWSEVDGEHGVGLHFQNGQPTEMLSWCYFF